MNLKERLRRRTKGLGFLTPVIEYTDEKSMVYRAYATQQQLAKIANEFFDEQDIIMGDQRLTPVGQNEKIRKLAESTLTEIKKLETSDAYLVPIQNELSRLEKEITPTETSDEQQNLGNVLREIEARRYLLTMDAGQRMDLLFKSAKLKDEVMYAAAINAPKSMGMFDDEILEQIKKYWGQQQRPEAASEYEKLKQAVDFLEYNIQETKQEVRHAAGLPPESDLPRDVIDILEGTTE